MQVKADRTQLQVKSERLFDKEFEKFIVLQKLTTFPSYGCPSNFRVNLPSRYSADNPRGQAILSRLGPSGPQGRIGERHGGRGVRHGGRGDNVVHMMPCNVPVVMPVQPYALHVGPVMSVPQMPYAWNMQAANIMPLGPKGPGPRNRGGTASKGGRYNNRGQAGGRGASPSGARGRGKQPSGGSSSTPGRGRAVAVPARGAASPGRGKAVPARGAASPGRGRAVPARGVASPGRGSGPRGRASPGKIRMGQGGGRNSSTSEVQFNSSKRPPGVQGSVGSPEYASRPQKRKKR